jgi:hypothetical protein
MIRILFFLSVLFSFNVALANDSKREAAVEVWFDSAIADELSKDQFKAVIDIAEKAVRRTNELLPLKEKKVNVLLESVNASFDSENGVSGRA